MDWDLTVTQGLYHLGDTGGTMTVQFERVSYA